MIQPFSPLAFQPFFQRLCLVFAATAAGVGQAQPFSETIAWSQQEVEQARAELATTREALLAEKRPKLEALTELQTAVLALRRERDSLVTRTAGATREVEREEAALRAFEQTLAFVSSRLQRLRSTFEESLHVAELASYREQLLAAERPPEGDEAAADAELAALARQWDIATSATTRLAGRVGGGRFDATVVADGVAAKGTALQIGPYVFFADDDRATTGVVRRGAGLEPRLYPLRAKDAAEISRGLTGGAARLQFDPTLDQAFVLAGARITWWEHVQRGGLWMIPIFLFGLVSALIGALKYAQVRKLAVPPPAQVDALVRIARRDGSRADFDSALAELDPALRPIFKEGYLYRKADESTREAAMHQAFIGFRGRLERRLGLIALTAAISPLLGLLGTVTGMIKTFQLISLYGTGDARALSSGISEALVTTEYGLIVAIPALLLHAVLSRRIKRIVVETAALMDKFNQTVSPEIEAVLD